MIQNLTLGFISLRPVHPQSDSWLHFRNSCGLHDVDPSLYVASLEPSVCNHQLISSTEYMDILLPSYTFFFA